MTGSEQVYVVVRLGLSIIAFVEWLLIFRNSVTLARRSDYADQRLFIMAVVGLLLLVVALLAFTAIYDWQRPPPADGALAFVGIANRTIVALGGFVILTRWPWNSEGMK